MQKDTNIVQRLYTTTPGTVLKGAHMMPAINSMGKEFSVHTYNCVRTGSVSLWRTANSMGPKVYFWYRSFE